MNQLRRARLGGVLGKYLLLIAFLGLLVGYFVWKEGYGTIGHVTPMPDSTAGFIAFIRDVGGKTDLFLVDAGGKDLRQRTDDGAPKRNPTWSPDGKQICFSGEPKNPGPDGRTFQLMLIGAGGARPLTYGSVSKTAPHWSPDGRFIGFLAGGAIKVIQPNGEGLKQIYPAPHAGSGTEEGAQEEDQGDEPDQEGRKPPINLFRWSPVGQSVAAIQVFEGEYAFTAGQQQWWEKDGQTASARPHEQAVVEPEAMILIPRIDSRRVERRPGTAAEKVGFGWYPNGSRIAVAVSTRLGQHGIASHRLDDELAAPEVLFASAGYTAAPENPAVSPDGQSIAFELWRMSSPEDRALLGIAVIPAAGDGVRVPDAKAISRVPLIIKDGSRPQWSPDGSRILFAKKSDSGRDLWVAKADGTSQVNLTNGSGDNFDAVWSPAK